MGYGFLCLHLFSYLLIDMDANTHYTKWRWQAPLGLLAVGTGASMLGHATLKKADPDESAWAWIAAGTGSLIVLNAGLCLFGDAIKHRMHYERLHDA